MNEGGKSFMNVGYLMGVALENDSRNVLSDDLDGDGRVDLLVVALDRRGADQAHLLRIFVNRCPGGNHWIGVRLQERGPGYSPVGAKVSIRTAGGTRVARIVTGDSFRSQHANTVHFGLGEAADVEWIEVRWPNGVVKRIPRPAVDRYHAVDPDPEKKPG